MRYNFITDTLWFLFNDEPMKILTLLFSFFSFTAHAKTVKIYCEPDSSSSANFTLAASLEIDESNSIVTDVLVSFKDTVQVTPSQIINTKGYFRSIATETSYSYLFPIQNNSAIVHFILRINTDKPSEIETKLDKKYLSNCNFVD